MAGGLLSMSLIWIQEKEVRWLLEIKSRRSVRPRGNQGRPWPWSANIGQHDLIAGIGTGTVWRTHAVSQRRRTCDPHAGAGEEWPAAGSKGLMDGRAADCQSLQQLLGCSQSQYVTS